ncbi:hypothetical protein EDB85DRAFT_1998498, partial [Lactarius pseudohatsudake]
MPPPPPFPSLTLCPRHPVRAERRRTRARRSPSPMSVPLGRDARGHAVVPSRGHPRFSLPPVRAAHLSLSSRRLPSHSHVRTEGVGTRARRCLSPRPLPSPFAWKECARGHAAPSPSVPPPLPWPRRPFAQKGCVRGHAAAALSLSPRPLPSHEGAHEDTTPPAPPLPLWPRRPVRAGRGHAKARHPTPPFPIGRATPVRAGKGHARARDPAPPFPIRAEGGCTRACRPLSPSPPTPPL